MLISDPDGRIQATLAATDDEWILVRPDGYLAARGTGEDALQAAVHHVSHLGADPEKTAGTAAQA
ncbi:hypothetical protein [Brachybacterium endophyticum]|uniref:hypothetical protein n=1 Tax=Brachybacterium endophyticum TaxID=2182385 RepID=UPI00196AB780|nr:hypothetical protein [Brachybacterium endophyticum]